MAVHRQGEGQVAFVGETALIKAVHQQKQQNDGARGNYDDGSHTDQHGQNCQQSVVIAGTGFLCPGKIPDGTSAQQPEAKAGGAQNTQHSGCGFEFMFQQFGKHLNTSRNSSSRDLPVSSRVSSALPERTTLPWYRKINSSSTRSTSEMRWVEIRMVALGS